GSQIVREIVIPALTKEVNENKNFAQLRQVYNSLILATWYKKKIKDSILNKVYTDKNKVNGLSFPKSSVGNPETIYQQYLTAFKKGVYNYIKEEQDPQTQQMIPRKYFSGGMLMAIKMDEAMTVTHDKIVITNQNLDHAQVVQVDMAMASTGRNREAVKARRDLLLEILNGLAEQGQLTVRELTERLNQRTGYETVLMQTIRDDLALDQRFQEPAVQARLSKESIDREAVKARRDLLLEILNGLAEQGQLTVRELTERLNQRTGYETVAVVTVNNDLALDQRFQEPAVQARLSIMKQQQGSNSSIIDRAMLMKKGGIDLTPANLYLQTRSSGGQIKFYIDPAMLQQLQNAPGFVPVIINIQPMNDLRLFLGIKDGDPSLRSG
ncbi:MAG: hypothetical protein Q7K71_01150, partial [Candidatus Omnitrophota bacterium]|nr:hypothetical protein [Candidatus Omnitrophota bacterium]